MGDWLRALTGERLSPVGRQPASDQIEVPSGGTEVYHQHKPPLILHLTSRRAHTTTTGEIRTLTVEMAASAQAAPTTTTTTNHCPLLFELSSSQPPLGTWQVGSRRTVLQRSPMPMNQAVAWRSDPGVSSGGAAMDPVENPQLPHSVRRAFCMYASCQCTPSVFRTVTLTLEAHVMKLKSRRMAIQKGGERPVFRIEGGHPGAQKCATARLEVAQGHVVAPGERPAQH